MRIITKREYFDPNWEAKKLEPKICERLYVQTEGAGQVGPFDTSAEAALWMKENHND